MKIEIRDMESVRAIQPADAALYLRAKHWAIKKQSENAVIWASTTYDDDFEILLPTDSEVRDYSLRMGELLGVLAIAEKRSQGLVYRDLLTTTSDVLRIRIDDPELSDGSLPIEEHAQIAQKSRDLVLAAACAATELRSVWHKRKPTQAMEQVRRVRIGQSERGSYVVTVICKITPLLQSTGKLFETDLPFDRQVTQTLAQSLSALQKASEQATLTQEMSAFEDAIPQGVNANLCDAVAGLWGGDEVNRHLDFSFSWSPARPVDSGMVQRIRLSADRIPVIREAGRQLREREPLLDFELFGPVVRLDREAGAPIGTATIFGHVDGRPVRIAVELDDKNYHTAVTAHDQERMIQAVGTLVKQGRGYRLANPQEFKEVLE